MAWTPRTILWGASLTCLMSLLVANAQQTDGPTDVPDNEMGPAAFLWPPDRVWSADVDNQAPCGSRAAPGNRTAFPLTGGMAALTGDEDYYSVKIGISFSENPTSNIDFTTIREGASLADIDPGNTCVSIPDPPPGITAGRNGTLQVIYTADEGTPNNQTFYACADITYVEPANFKTRIPCFNKPPNDDDGVWNEDDDGIGEDDNDNDDNDDDEDDDDGDRDLKGTATKSGVGSVATRLPADDDDDEDEDDEDEDGELKESHKSGGGGGGLSRGAVAGIVAGTISAVVLLSAAALLWYRRRLQNKRKVRLTRMEDNARAAGHVPGGSITKEPMYT